MMIGVTKPELSEALALKVARQSLSARQICSLVLQTAGCRERHVPAKEGQLHCEVLKYYRSTSKARARVLQDVVSCWEPVASVWAHAPCKFDPIRLMAHSRTMQ